MGLTEIIQNRFIKSDQKNEKFKQNMEVLASLETEEERMNRRIRLLYVFSLGLLFTILFGVIAVFMVSLSIPPFQSVNIFNPDSLTQRRWMGVAVGIIASPLLIMILYGFLDSLKTYRKLKKRYVQKFDSKPEISSLDYVFTPYF